jgi:PKD repeat protein
VALTYAWDFENDGVVDSTEQSPLFTYANPGTYDVSLTVTNAAGPNTMVKEAYITAEKPTAAPEFPTIALPAVLIICMLGTVLLIRRTKEN